MGRRRTEVRTFYENHDFRISLRQGPQYARLSTKFSGYKKRLPNRLSGWVGGGAKSLQICAPMPGSEMGRSPNRAHETPLARQYGSEIPIKYFGNKYN